MKVRFEKIEGNKLKIDERDIVAFDRWKDKFSVGSEVTAEFKKRQEDSSERARNYFHVLRDRYAAELGYDKEHAKNELCRLFGVWVNVDELAMQDPPEWSGHLVDIGYERIFRKSLNDYSREELSDLIEGTIHACVENDINVQSIVADYRRGV